MCKGSGILLLFALVFLIPTFGLILVNPVTGNLIQAQAPTPTPAPPGYTPHIAVGASASETGRTAGYFRLLTTYVSGPVVNEWLKVNYMVSGTAANGIDYGFLKGYVYVAAGTPQNPPPEEPANMIVIKPADNITGDGPKTVTITLNTGESATMTIEDNPNATTPGPTATPVVFDIPRPAIEAEDFAAMYGVQKEICTDGGWDMTAIDTGD